MPFLSWLRSAFAPAIAPGPYFVCHKYFGNRLFGTGVDELSSVSFSGTGLEEWKYESSIPYRSRANSEAAASSLITFVWHKSTVGHYGGAGRSASKVDLEVCVTECTGRRTVARRSFPGGPPPPNIAVYPGTRSSYGDVFGAAPSIKDVTAFLSAHLEPEPPPIPQPVQPAPAKTSEAASARQPPAPAPAERLPRRHGMYDPNRLPP